MHTYRNSSRLRTNRKKKYPLTSRDQRKKTIKTLKKRKKRDQKKSQLIFINSLLDNLELKIDDKLTQIERLREKNNYELKSTITQFKILKVKVEDYQALIYQSVKIGNEDSKFFSHLFTLRRNTKIDDHIINRRKLTIQRKSSSSKIFFFLIVIEKE